MDCREFELFVHAYIDGEFDAHEQVMVESHLASCASCRARAKHERMFREQLRTSYHAVAESAPASLRARICASLSSKRAAPPVATLGDRAVSDDADAERDDILGVDLFDDDGLFEDDGPFEDDEAVARVFEARPAGLRLLSVVGLTDEDDADEDDADEDDAEHDGEDEDDDAVDDGVVVAREGAEGSARDEGARLSLEARDAAAAIERISAELEAIALEAPAPVAAVAPAPMGQERAARAGVVRRRAPRWVRRLAAPAVSAVAAIVVLGAAWSFHGALAPPLGPTAAPSEAAQAAEGAALDLAEREEAELDPEPIVQEAVTWHQRDVPVEVTGPSDRRVRRWFHGKVNFPVRLPRFENNRVGEVNLLGARLSNVREKQAAYVIYEANGSKLSVMVFNRSRGERPLHKAARNPDVVRAATMRRPIYFQNANGYNVAVVEDNGVTYSITSELPRDEMVELVDAAFRP